VIGIETAWRRRRRRKRENNVTVGWDMGLHHFSHPFIRLFVYKDS
jgi:hypothetical protein